MIKGGKELLNPEVESLFYGIRKHEYGFEALAPDIKKIKQKLVKTNIAIEKPTLEDIMFFMTSNNGGVDV